MARFVGKRALVTGAGKGFGRAIAIALLEGGAETIALSRTQADLDSLKQEYPQMQTVCQDISDWDQTRKMVQDLGPIDLLVNNAGIPRPSSFLDTTKEDLDTIMDINVKATFNISQVVGKSMVERGKGGAIVNMSSICGQKAASFSTPYCMTKGAVDQLTRAMALDLGSHQIRVNSVVPSAVRTNMTETWFAIPGYLDPFLKRTPLGKFAEIKHVVSATLYLLSDEAEMVNGTSLAVDGGYLAV